LVEKILARAGRSGAIMKAWKKMRNVAAARIWSIFCRWAAAPPTGWSAPLVFSM
jgi:hypothetical protein